MRMSLILSALFGFIFLVIQLSLYPSETTLYINLTSSSQKNVFQVFYDLGNGYREEYSVRRPVAKEKHQVLSFPLPPRAIKHLRIDPGHSPGEVYIQSLTLRYQNFFRVRELMWTPQDILKDFVPLNHIDRFLEKEHLLYLRSTDKDPYFAIKYPLDLFDNLLEYLSFFALGFAIGMLFIQTLWKCLLSLFAQIRQTFIPSSIIRYSFIFVLALMSVMAVTSAYNHHPDEHHHFLAAEYYINHWFPPEIGEPSVRHTYSVYGSSYLNYYWIEYLLIGKFAGLLSPALIENPVVAARLFNVLLFSLLIVVFFHRSHKNTQELVALCAVLITPQVWYIFAYVNNDAFPLCLSLLVISEITYLQSPFNKFLLDTKNLSGGFLLGLLLGLLLISKQNYYIFILFIGGLFFLRSVNVKASKISIDKTLLWKYIFVFSIACFILVAKFSLDIATNGESTYFRSLLSPHTTNSKLLDYEERVAHAAFKPSLIKNHSEKSYFSLRLREKGLAYSELFSKWQWHEISFKSFVGYYGYMSIAAPQTYYTIMKILYLAFFLFLFLSVLRSQHQETLLAMGGILLGMVGTVLISSYHSWTMDFQAQGRYLFPIISLLGFLLYQVRHVLSHFITQTLILSLVGCSVYSFIFVALTHL